MNPNSVSSKQRPTSDKFRKLSYLANKKYASKVSCGSVSSAESVVSFSNSNIDAESDEELGFTSDSDFEEHPYSVAKKMKLSDCGLSNKSSPGLSPISKLKMCNSNPKDPKLYTTGSELNCNFAFSSKRKSKCNSKNAVMARMNRLKKKIYIEDMEARNQKLEEESKVLKEMLSSSQETIAKLKRETFNLRSVIKNSTELGKLLQCIHNNTNLQISSSLLHSFKAEPYSSEMSSHATSSPTTALASQCSSNSVEAEVKEGNLAQEVFADNSLLNLNDELHVGLSSFLSASEFSCNQLIEPCLSPSLNLNFAELDSSLMMRCETPTNGINSDDAQEPLFEEVGVCFHIANKKVSLEFCESCNFKAALTNN